MTVRVNEFHHRQQEQPRTMLIAQNVGSIINQNSANYGMHTVINSPPQRTLTVAQHDTLVSILKQSDSSSVVVKSAESNFEAQTYADSLAAALKDSGWTVDRRGGSYEEIRQGSGLQIMVHDLASAPQAAITLQKA